MHSHTYMNITHKNKAVFSLCSSNQKFQSPILLLFKICTSDWQAAHGPFFVFYAAQLSSQIVHYALSKMLQF